MAKSCAAAAAAAAFSLASALVRRLATRGAISEQELDLKLRPLAQLRACKVCAMKIVFPRNATLRVGGKTKLASHQIVVSSAPDCRRRQEVGDGGGGGSLLLPCAGAGARTIVRALFQIEVNMHQLAGVVVDLELGLSCAFLAHSSASELALEYPRLASELFPAGRLRPPAARGVLAGVRRVPHYWMGQCSCAYPV